MHFVVITDQFLH